MCPLYHVDSSVATIIVSDSGIGIPVPERDKVFRRFYRVESSRSVYPGNGLGLSLVSAVVKFHQGAIQLDDNKPGLYVKMLLPLYLSQTSFKEKFL